MYDRVTEALIHAVPDLDALDRAELPKRLTEAFAAIVSLRVRAQKRELTEEEAVDLREQLDLLRRLGNTFETLACLLDAENPHRAACAFVAGTAHQLLQRIRSSRGIPLRGHLEPDGISSQVASILLFMIAGAFPDAAEMAQELQNPVGDSVEQVLQQGLLLLARGRLAEILRLPGEPASSGMATLEGTATELLWRRLFLGLRVLASELSGAQSPVRGVAAEELFSEVQRLAVTKIDLSDLATLIDVGGPAPEVLQVFGGPHHLATLLLASAGVLRRHSALKIECPSNEIETAEWRRFLERVSRGRPCLWPNHIDAISKGLLRPGVSAAISFPTGAGKSTLIQMKIAATILRGYSVLFLVPTLVLVDQVRRDLRSVISSAAPRADHDEGADDRPRVLVMTPERCLALLSTSDDGLSRIGLVVLDECHILHPRSLGDDRRSLDSMLCLLSLFEQTPDADFILLSAMMANAGEIAGWISATTERSCLALDLDWKPTRQARGCVVYLQKDIEGLKRILADEQVKARSVVRAGRRKAKAPGVAVARKMTIVPYGFFSLRNSWSTDRVDYSLQRLLSGQVTLGVSNAGRAWLPTANRNKVSALLAAAYASAGIKTMVLAQNARDLPSLAREAEAELSPDVRPVTLLPDEELLLELASDELGGIEHTFRPLNGRAAIHHGLLLPAERRLSEQVFSREDGVAVLVVSPTLAQGVNLPAGAIIIAGDDRWDPVLDARRKLEAQDLLNAAGRAGRAGSASLGVVLVVPGEAVGIDPGQGRLEKRWFDLQERVFSKSDQCLEIQDPLEVLLDRLQDLSRISSDATLEYFLCRLPVDEDGTGERPRRFLGRSLAAFHAGKRGESATYRAHVDKIMAARRDHCGHAGTWHDKVSSATGVPVWVIRQLDEDLGREVNKAERDVLGWVAWWFDWLGKDGKRADTLLPPPLLRSLAGKEYEEVPRGAGFYARILPALRRRIEAWMTGSPLCDIEILWGVERDKVGTCDNSRDLVLRHMPHVAATMSLIGRVVDAQAAAVGGTGASLALTKLGACAREGLATVEQLVLHMELGEVTSRVRVHRSFATILPHLDPAVPGEEFDGVRERVRKALEVSGAGKSE